MKILVRECGFTGKLFKNDSDYRIHLDDLRREQREARQRQRDEITYAEDNEEIFKLESIQEIEDWLNDNIWRICQYGPNFDSRQFYYGRKALQSCKPEQTIHISLTEMRFKEVGTTHSAPRGRPTTGWHDKLVKEWAWQGRITVRMKNDGYDYFDSDFLEDVGVHTGSGGGNSDKLSFSVTLYAADFKAMARKEVYKKLITP